ncbi:MAG TPA: lysophospholipid acyltransferase family protein [bacterium]|nr:lysophospholipid acyltransferase family protein [bacterium]
MKWKEIRHRLILFVLPVLAWILRILLATLRMRVVGQEYLDEVASSDHGAIFVFWHSRILYMLVAGGTKIRVHTLVSMNRDGEYIARVAASFGRPTVRGSSSRGGAVALMNMARILESGDSVAFTPDGPRGPREVFQAGAVHLSLRTGRPIVPAAYSARWKKRFASWDGFVLPYPFSRGVFIVGAPLWPEDFPKEEQACELMRQAAESALRQLTVEADRMVES